MKYACGPSSNRTSTTLPQRCAIRMCAQLCDRLNPNDVIYYRGKRDSLDHPDEIKLKCRRFDHHEKLLNCSKSVLISSEPVGAGVPPIVGTVDDEAYKKGPEIPEAEVAFGPVFPVRGFGRYFEGLWERLSSIFLSSAN